MARPVSVSFKIRGDWVPIACSKFFYFYFERDETRYLDIFFCFEPKPASFGTTPPKQLSLLISCKKEKSSRLHLGYFVLIQLRDPFRNRLFAIFEKEAPKEDRSGFISLWFHLYLYL